MGYFDDIDLLDEALAIGSKQCANPKCKRTFLIYKKERGKKKKYCCTTCNISYHKDKKLKEVINQ